MKLLFWISTLTLIYIYIGYPLLLCVFGLLSGKKVLRAEEYPSVSLIISAYNEEQVIGRKILNSLQIDYPKDKLEIIIVSESTDRTNEIVSRYFQQGVKLFAYAGRNGKSFSLYRAVPEAQGEIVVFSDANAFYKGDAIKKIVRNFHDARIGCVSGMLVYENPDETSIGESEGFYWKYEMMIKRLESRLFSLAGSNGSIFALRKQLYKPLSPYRGDDFELTIGVLLDGYGVILEKEAVSIEHCSRETIDEFNRKVRIVAGMGRSACAYALESIKNGRLFLLWQIMSHKLLRWVAPIFYIGTLCSAMLLPSPFYRTLLVAQLIFYMLAVCGYVMERCGRKLPLFINVPYYMCVVHLAALIGLVKSLVNNKNILWKPVHYS